MIESRSIRATFSCMTCSDRRDVNYGVAFTAISYAPPVCCERMMCLIVAPLGVAQEQGFLLVAPSAGEIAHVLDIIPIAHRDHGVKGWDRHIASRGWHVGCACGISYEVDDDSSVPFRDVEEWFSASTRTPRTGDVKWNLDANSYYVSDILGSDSPRASRLVGRIKVDGADAEPVDALDRRAVSEGRLPMKTLGKWIDARSDQKRSIRSAMAAMSNVMCCWLEAHRAGEKMFHWMERANWRRDQSQPGLPPWPSAMSYTPALIVEQIAAWLDKHGNDDEFRNDERNFYGCDYADPAKLAAAIREGRWRK